MTPLEKGEDPRRRWLVQALSAGLFLSNVPGGPAQAQVLGSRPGPLPAGRSIYKLSGSVRVNAQDANLETVIKPGDTIETGANSEVIFVIGGHSMILRANSKMTAQGQATANGGAVLTAMNLAAGKILSVSRNARTSIATPTAAIVIRGTGWYVESDPEQTYFCTCYGTTEVEAVNDARSREVIVAVHHDRPVYVLGQATSGQRIQDAPFLNHTDQELALIEALVGRLQPNVFPKDSYGGPRRSY